MDDEIKKGARNNSQDQARIQNIHDYAVENGAVCGMEKSIEADELVYFGNTVKAVKLDDGSVKLGGYLVTFGDVKNTDLTGDFFTPDTDYGEASESDVYFNHRLPVEADGIAVEYKSRLSRARLVKDDVGIFAETILKARNEYEQMIVDIGLAGKLGWSSGTAGHLMEKEPAGKAWRITAWPIGLDASLTPHPAEARNSVVPLKSLLSANPQVETERAAQDKREAKAIPESQSPTGRNAKGVEMELTEERLQELLTQASADGAKKAIEATEPVKTAGVNIEVTHDEADNEFSSIAEQCVAVKNFTLSHGRTYDPRLKRLQYKAVQGASENVPADGGVLLEPTIAAGIVQNIHEVGPFSADINMLPVSGNSNSGWVNGVDETSRATGSRWGGIRGYRLAEGDALTKSKPTFRRINWELKKYGVLVYGTDELLQDAAQFSAIVNQAAREEIAFMVNDDIMNGLGVSGAQGFMNSGALITVTRDTGSAVKGADISAMWQRLTPTSKARSKWYVHTEVAPSLDAIFAVGSTAVLFPYAGYRPDGVRTLYGRPIIETEFNAALNTTGDIVLADMNSYLGWQKGDVQYATSIHVEFLTDQEVMRFIYRFDGKSAFSSALSNYKGSGTTSPFVVLGSAT